MHAQSMALDLLILYCFGKSENYGACYYTGFPVLQAPPSPSWVRRFALIPILKCPHCFLLLGENQVSGPHVCSSMGQMLETLIVMYVGKFCALYSLRVPYRVNKILF